MCEIYDKIQQEGIAIGEERGKAEGEVIGILKTLVELVKDGIITLETVRKPPKIWKKDEECDIIVM